MRVWAHTHIEISHMPDSRYLFFLNDSIITRKQYVQRKLVLYSSSVPKARVKPFSSMVKWNRFGVYGSKERERKALLKRWALILILILIVNKSSVKLWDSRQDSCSFENVNWPKFVFTFPYSTYTISEPLVKSNQFIKLVLARPVRSSWGCDWPKKPVLSIDVSS